MNGFSELIKTLGPTRLAAMGAVAAILVGAFAFIMLRVSSPQMAPLYTDLTFEDSSAIITQLESLGVNFEVRRDGATIAVPQDEILRLRMRLAEDGLPTGGSVGYEIFDKTDTLGATSFVQNVNLVRALEGELARTIRTIDRVQAVRVHLVLPERQLFQRDRQPPTASIVLKVRGTLEQSQVRAIQHLVASAVEGLSPSSVSIVDESGRLLASGDEEGNEGFIASSLQEQSVQMERRLRLQVEEIVNSVVGIGRSRVKVSAELDFNRRTETSEQFDPESQVVRSTQTREDNSTSTDQPEGVTVGNQLPDADVQNGGTGKRDVSSSSEEVINYEISKSTRTEVIEAGGLKRLSVAVLVDGSYAPDANGDMQYTPRTQEQLDRIALLVRSAVGFDETRGDTVEVVNLRFAEGPNALFVESEEGLFDFTRADLMRFVELGVLLLITVLLSLFAVRPLIKKILHENEPEPALVVDSNGQLVEETALTDQRPEQETQESGEEKIGWLEEAQAAGAMQATTMNKVGEMIEEYPTEAVTIIRGWLNEAA